MYSYEDRLRAVQLYIKLGKRTGMTIRQLGYPTKNALKTWHREYEQRRDLPAGYVRPPRYSQAQKELAIEHYLEHGRCLAATIKALGYPSRTLLPAWVQEVHPETRTCVVVRTQELTPAMKQSAVIALCMRQGSAQSVAQELGVSRPSLYNWKNQLLGQLDREVANECLECGFGHADEGVVVENPGRPEARDRDDRRSFRHRRRSSARQREERTGVGRQGPVPVLVVRLESRPDDSCGSRVDDHVQAADRRDLLGNSRRGHVASHEHRLGSELP